MELPKTLKFEALMFSDGANGMHQQMFRNEEYGITVTSFKESQNHAWVITFTVDRFKDKVFNSGKEVTKAFEKESAK